MTRLPLTSSPRADRLPRLTEVVEWSAPALVPEGRPLDGDSDPEAGRLPLPQAVATTPGEDATDAGSGPGDAGPLSPGGWPADEEALRRQITEAVLADLQRRVELTLEARLRELLAPLLARTTERLLNDARTALDHALGDWVAQAVAQEMARRRPSAQDGASPGPRVPDLP
jgi:hypothetical protein